MALGFKILQPLGEKEGAEVCFQTILKTRLKYNRVVIDNPQHNGKKRLKHLP